MKISNWKSSGKPQEKSQKTPKARKRKARQLAQMMQRLKENSGLSSPILFFN